MSKDEKRVKGRPPIKKTIRTAYDSSTEGSESQDEVDNVMSKFSRENQSFHNRTRQHSVSPHNTYHYESEYDDSDELQKSDHRDELPSNKQNINISSSQSKSNKTHRKDDKSLVINQHHSLFNFIWLSIIVVVAVSCYYLYNNILYYNKSVLYDKENFRQDMSYIKNKYNIDRDSILKLQTGISTIFDKSDTGAFIFVYNSNGKQFDAFKLSNIINEIANIAAKLLRNHNQSSGHIDIDSSKLNMKNHTELINTYREPIAEFGVMLVKHMESIPSNLAMAFHYYCDEYNPLVERTAIFFTLDVSKCTSSSDVKTYHTLVEKCLSKRWKTIPQESVNPLLARVVSVIIDFTNIFEK